MQVKIKCLECGRRTMYHDVGKVFYNIDNSSDILFEKEIICNKCKADISNKKAEIDNYFYMALITANICRSINVEDGSEIPEHLRGAFCVKTIQMEKARAFCRTVPIMEDKPPVGKRL